MKLLLIRHAIAVPRGTPGVSDNERPLTPEGKTEFMVAARGLARIAHRPDVLLTSPLPRARVTAEIAAGAFTNLDLTIEPALARGVDAIVAALKNHPTNGRIQPMTVEWGYAVRDLAASGDFDDEVKRATAALAADRCSNPNCRALTSGPTNDRRKSLTVGVIAPISAMLPGGHRYDATLSDAERHDQGNAIWLCYTCARQVNYDVAHFPADMLRSWKKEAGGAGGE